MSWSVAGTPLTSLYAAMIAHGAESRTAHLTRVRFGLKGARHRAECDRLLRYGPYPGHWSSSGEPAPWRQPDQRAVAQETLSVVEQALETLPERQRSVVTMRDVQGFSAAEVCTVLDLSPGNQRVLLNRGPRSLRGVLEDYYRA